MKIAITDASLIIVMYELGLADHYFKLNIETHISRNIFNQVYPHQRDDLDTQELLGTLYIHTIGSNERSAMNEINFPQTFCVNDRSSVFVAQREKAYILSSDKNVREFITDNIYEEHGMFWIINELLETKAITNDEAVSYMRELSLHTLFPNSAEAQSKIKHRLDKLIAQL